MQENWTREDDKKRSQTSVWEFARERERETGGDIRNSNIPSVQCQSVAYGNIHTMNDE